MAVLLDVTTKLLIQGITGHQGRFHAKACKEFGTYVVGGVTPGKGGTKVDGLPVFDTVRQAVREVEPNTSLMFVPAPYAKDAAFEALDAGIRTLIIITEHVPVHDAIQIVNLAGQVGARVLGPNGPGAISPCQGVKAGIMPSSVFTAGDIGVVSRSGTLTYEIVNHLTLNGIGQSSVFGLGGDPVTGTSFIDALDLFQADAETKVIVLVGEIGGRAEEDAADHIAAHIRKPVVAYVAGQSAPEGKRMGHAGAIITRGRGTAASKRQALENSGVKVAAMPHEVPKIVRQLVKGWEQSIGGKDIGAAAREVREQGKGSRPG